MGRVCECGCTDTCEYESQEFCADCGRTLSDVDLAKHGSIADNAGGTPPGWNFVSSSSDGSNLCAPVSRREPRRLQALQMKVIYLSNILNVPQNVLDQATPSLCRLCSQSFQYDSDGTRACVALFYACRVEQYPLTLRSIFQALGESRDDVTACLNRFNAVSQMPCPPLQVGAFISRCVHQYAASNRLSSSVSKVFLTLANRLFAFSRRHVNVSSPLWQAAASVVLALAFATHTKPSAQVAANLNLGVNHEGTLQRHIPALIHALRVQAQHSPGENAPYPSMNSLCHPEASNVAASLPEQHLPAVHCQYPLTDSATQACSQAIPGLPSFPGNVSAACARDDPIPSAFACEENAPIMPITASTRHLRDPVESDSQPCCSDVRRSCKKVPKAKRKRGLSGVWKGGVEKTPKDGEPTGEIPLTLSVVQGILDVDECLALCG